MAFYKTGTSSQRTVGNSHVERDMSGQLVRLIDLLFGLVIVQGALFYRPLLAAHGDRNVPAFLVLGVVIYTVVRSFVDWHQLMERMPYQIMTKADTVLRPRFQIRTVDLWRLYVDFLIVATYALLLMRGHVLLENQAAELKLFFWIFAGVFVLYLIWGELLRRTAGAQQFEEWLLVIALALAVVLALAYTLVLSWGALSGHGTLRNVGALAIAGTIMVGYRFFNWRQQETIETPR